MKRTIPLMILALGHIAASGETLPIRDAATHEQLAARLRQAVQNDPVRKLESSQGDDPSKVNQPADLVASSDILCHAGRATLVPKRAVLHIPPALAERMKFRAGAKIQIWSEFLIENRGWITTLEVSRVQAEGNQPLSEETVTRIAQSDKLVVATFQGGPISVLPLKPSAAPPTAPVAETASKHPTSTQAIP